MALLLAGSVTSCKSLNIACKVRLTVSTLKIYFIKEQNVQAVRVLFFDFLCQVNAGLGQNRNRLEYGRPLPFPLVCKALLQLLDQFCFMFSSTAIWTKNRNSDNCAENAHA